VNWGKLMSATVELQIAQICIAVIQVISLWVLVFFAIRAWNKERMTDYEYYTLLIGLKEGRELPINLCRRASRYAARHDRANAKIWKRFIIKQRVEARRRALRDAADNLSAMSRK